MNPGYRILKGVAPLAFIFLPAMALAQAPQSCQACVVALDPQATQAFAAGNGAAVTLNNCGLNVNSSNSSAFYATGGAHVSAAWAIKI
jgi:hypothetical protein